MNEINLLFGIPIFKSKILENEYNKQEIISNIEKNYSIDPHRNVWRANSNLHHMYADYDNLNFIQIDFSQLTDLYNKKLIDFFDNFIEGQYEFTWNLVNYTCMKKNQFMDRHDHLDCDFTGIHYIKFNKKHEPTLYHNPAIWNDFMPAIPFFELKKRTQNNNSFLHRAWYISVEEDDFVVSPGVLSHSVLKSEIDDLRVTLVINIRIKR